MDINYKVNDLQDFTNLAAYMVSEIEYLESELEIVTNRNIELEEIVADLELALENPEEEWHY